MSPRFDPPRWNRPMLHPGDTIDIVWEDGRRETTTVIEVDEDGRVTALPENAVDDAIEKILS